MNPAGFIQKFFHGAALTTSSIYKTRTYVVGAYTYTCEALPGALVASAAWRITRSDGNSNFDHAGASAAACGQFDQVATNSATVAALSYF